MPKTSFVDMSHPALTDADKKLLTLLQRNVDRYRRANRSREEIGAASSLALMYHAMVGRRPDVDFTDFAGLDS